MPDRRECAFMESRYSGPRSRRPPTMNPTNMDMLSTDSAPLLGPAPVTWGYPCSSWTPIPYPASLQMPPLPSPPAPVSPMQRFLLDTPSRSPYHFIHSNHHHSSMPGNSAQFGHLAQPSTASSVIGSPRSPLSMQGHPVAPFSYSSSSSSIADDELYDFECTEYQASGPRNILAVDVQSLAPNRNVNGFDVDSMQNSLPCEFRATSAASTFFSELDYESWALHGLEHLDSSPSSSPSDKQFGWDLLERTPQMVSCKVELDPKHDNSAGVSTTPGNQFTRELTTERLPRMSGRRKRTGHWHARKHLETSERKHRDEIILCDPVSRFHRKMDASRHKTVSFQKNPSIIEKSRHTRSDDGWMDLSWLNAPTRNALWINGTPGAGKSTLMSYLNLSQRPTALHAVGFKTGQLGGTPLNRTEQMEDVANRWLQLFRSLFDASTPANLRYQDATSDQKDEDMNIPCGNCQNCGIGWSTLPTLHTSHDGLHHHQDPHEICELLAATIPSLLICLSAMLDILRHSCASEATSSQDLSILRKRDTRTHSMAGSHLGGDVLMCA